MKEAKPKKIKKRGCFALFVKAIGGFFGLVYISFVQLLCTIGIMGQYLFLALWGGGVSNK